MYKTLAIIALLFVAVTGSLLDLTKVDEGSCVKPPVSRKLDVKWLLSQNSWYLPLASKYEVYRAAQVMLEKDINTIEEGELTNYCVQGTLSAGKMVLNAFGGTKRVGMELKLAGQGAFTWKTNDSGDWNASGTSYAVRTNNKNYVLLVNYWNEKDDKKISWSVLSTEKSLAEKTKNDILKHVASLGFDTEKAFEVDYDKCNEKDEL